MGGNLETCEAAMQPCRSSSSSSSSSSNARAPPPPSIHPRDRSPAPPAAGDPRPPSQWLPAAPSAREGPRVSMATAAHAQPRGCGPGAASRLQMRACVAQPLCLTWSALKRRFETLGWTYVFHSYAFLNALCSLLHFYLPSSISCVCLGLSTPSCPKKLVSLSVLISGNRNNWAGQSHGCLPWPHSLPVSSARLGLTTMPGT